MKGQPREIVEQGFERDRQDYWAMRGELLAKYSGRWVAVHKGRVTAVGDDPDRKSTRLNSSHIQKSRMPSSA